MTIDARKLTIHTNTTIHKKTYNNTPRQLTTIHTRQLQPYTQDNYNNTYKTTNNNKHKTTTTIHTRQITTIHTIHIKIHVQKVNNTKVRK